jgi:DNA polymerase
MGVSTWYLRERSSAYYSRQHSAETECQAGDSQPNQPHSNKPMLHNDAVARQTFMPKPDDIRPVTEQPGRSEQTNEHQVATIHQQSITLDNSTAVIHSELTQPAPAYQADPELLASIKACQQCPSRATRLNPLAGHGYDFASVFIIGAAPSDKEDRQGRYLPDSANTLLNAMLQTIGLAEHFFYTGLLKCYSMHCFTYNQEDLQHCFHYLQQQIDALKPSAIMVLGAAEAQAVLNTQRSFNELRGQVHEITIFERTYPVVVSYQPGYLLRNPLYKKTSFNDLLLLKKLLA